jgi:glycosyltransferase EpsJ
VEKYLPQCVNSLLGQTLREIEIILVNDGSPDKCGQMAEQYTLQDSRIQVIHRENGGLGAARNTGIRAASGDYIGFLDSDDWAHPEMYRRLYDAAVRCGADIAVGGHCDMADGKVVTSKIHPLAGTTLTDHGQIMDIRKHLYGHGVQDTHVEAFPMSVCMSLYRREMLLNHGILFQSILSEDTIFNLDVYRFADVITFTADTDYCYRKENQTSITNSFSDATIGKYQNFLSLLAEKAAEEEDPECVIRAKRMAIDYCRLYVGVVNGADLCFRDKKMFIRQFAVDQTISRCWEGYPVKTLPIQQRLFQQAILCGHYGMALRMNSLRQMLKNRGRM